jgi:hypothetical protein
LIKLGLDSFSLINEELIEFFKFPTDTITVFPREMFTASKSIFSDIGRDIFNYVSPLEDNDFFRILKDSGIPTGSTQIQIIKNRFLLYSVYGNYLRVFT